MNVLSQFIQNNQTLAKTISFAILHFSVAFSVAYLLTGSLVIGGLIALLEPMVNTVAFFFHEKFWQKISQPTAIATG